jgi:hypothetical protein
VDAPTTDTDVTIDDPTWHLRESGGKTSSMPDILKHRILLLRAVCGNINEQWCALSATTVSYAQSHAIMLFRRSVAALFHNTWGVALATIRLLFARQPRWRIASMSSTSAAARGNIVRPVPLVQPEIEASKGMTPNSCLAF